MSNERSSWLWRDPGEAQRSREGGQESRRGAGAGPGGRGRSCSSGEDTNIHLIPGPGGREENEGGLALLRPRPRVLVV